MLSRNEQMRLSGPAIGHFRDGTSLATGPAGELCWSTIRQQIGDNTASATARRLECQLVPRSCKWFQIIGYATSAHSYGDALLKQGNPV
jgi:hypothetical protein